MKRNGLAKSKLCLLLGALALLALVPQAGFANVYDLTYYLDLTTNSLHDSIYWDQQRGAIQSSLETGARWGIANVDAGTTNIHNSTRTLDLGSGISQKWYFIRFRTMTNYYVPQTASVFLVTSASRTNFYAPYSNTLSVTTPGTSNTVTNAVWYFSAQSPEFINSSVYQARYTNRYDSLPVSDLTPIPTGSYTVVFLPVAGYITPPSVTTNITGASPQTSYVTGTYERALGTITVIVSPTNGTWEFRPGEYPADFTDYSASPLSGTGGTNILTNCPAGAYTIRWGQVDGLMAPDPQTHTNMTELNTNDIFRGAYASGPAVFVYILHPGEPDPQNSSNYLAGIGTGSYSVVVGAGQFLNGNWHFPTNTSVSLLAVPTNGVFLPDTNVYDSFFFEWYDPNSVADGTLNRVNINQPISFTMPTSNVVLWLLFSRECKTYDNVGDLDLDYLPDEWERLKHLDPKNNDNKVNGRAGNMDGDWIPSSFNNPPWVVSISNMATSYLIADGSSILNPYAGYPLRGNRLYNPSLALDGYARTNIPFDNYLECRGLDGYYKNNGMDTNGADQVCPNDDPFTDPRVADTDGDGMTDGWEYYFWYWRSANAFNAGISNSANLDWVMISPCEERTRNGGFVPSNWEWDTDNDGLSDGEEYEMGTDPTHADTDGDSMDDVWESQFGYGTNTSPLNALDGMANYDDDYIAISAGARVLTNGTVGTRITNAVYNLAGSAWIEFYTNSGVGRFDLYQDKIIILAGALSNHVTGVAYSDPVYYGATNGFYKTGHPVWVDTDHSGTYSAGDLDLFNPLCKHEYVYLHDIAAADVAPGATSFSPNYAWRNAAADTNLVINTFSYVGNEEYMGGDYLGRLSWNAGGFVPYINGDNDGETPPALSRNAYTDPSRKDTDGDLIPDGWELYVGLNPSDSVDGVGDEDGDGLNNQLEWANATDPLGTVSNSWPLKLWPTDPGVLVAPPPNDPHPMDTDWDGLSDGEEYAIRASVLSGDANATNTMMVLSNPSAYDSDSDMLPDGWEVYGGTQAGVADADADPDGDGLENWREYWTGAVPEWQLCDANWGAYFCSRKTMKWDVPDVYFIPPDFFSCPSALYVNGVFTDLAYLRTNYPAAGALGGVEYHTTLANNPDSDYDGMDDFWEVYHGLNPLKGSRNLMMPLADSLGLPIRPEGVGGAQVGVVDADPASPGFQFGTANQIFTSFSNLIAYVPVDPGSRVGPIINIVGPFNFGLDRMDPDGDGLPNTEEYSYSTERSLYHTDPSPIWRTDDKNPNSFASLNYVEDYFNVGPEMPDFFTFTSGEPVFPHEQTEGFDTDNDGVGDYNEINSSSGLVGTDSLDARNPTRNRAVMLNGTNDFLRNTVGWIWPSESALAKFSVEAWIRPRNPTKAGEQVVLEKAGIYLNPYSIPTNIIRANFRMGITNGLPYVMYNGRGAMTTYLAKAQIAHRLKPDAWAHIAGTYDGTNLTIYVNGEASAILHTTELPATTGYLIMYEGGAYITNQSIIVGARDNTPGYSIPSTVIQPADYFNGLIDEVRVWNGVRSRAQIIANKDRRFTSADLNSTNSITSSLWSYYTFDDVPDPRKEGVVPAGMDILDTTLSFHPTMNWWRDYPLHSTVYTGSAAMAYNYLVTAEDHIATRPILPPRDDFYHYPSNSMSDDGTYELLPGYRNTSNPYGEETFRWVWHIDLCLFNGAQAVATNSWLASLDPGDPDSTDTDGDGLPDWWEQKYGLDYNDATGDNGAWGDPDNDGLNNRAEYLAGTNPRTWDTVGDGISDYDSRRGPGSRTWGELYMDGDGMPDTWEIQYGLDPYAYDANLDKDNDGWSNYAEYQAGTDPSRADSYPQPRLSFSLSYSSTNTESLAILGYQTNTMDGMPALSIAGGTSSNFTLTGFKEGDFYLFGFLDLNGDGLWSSGEACGVARPQPVNVAWADMEGPRLGLRDSAPGYGRFAWTEPAGTDKVEVVINRTTESGAPTVLSRTLRLPRNYFHEWDYQLSGLYGLSAGAYRWWVGSQNGVFSVAWPSVISKPSLVFPRGDTFYYARERIAWQMDKYSTLYHLQIADASKTILTNYYLPAPCPDVDGIYRDDLPFHLGEWANGPYFWRVASVNPIGESEWSEAQTFNIDLTSTNSYWISGDLYYFGKARATNIFVEAFANPGFGGEPEARMLYRVPCTTNAFKTAFTLRGLRPKTYYVRAYTDITPAGGERNGRLDSWESWGFVKSPENDYQPDAIVMKNTHFVEDTEIVIRDRDTDNDHLPDAWEMSYFGDLDQTGDMDYDDDGENNLTEYALDILDTDPTLFDTDGDGLTDYYEHHYGNNVDYDPYDALNNPNGKSLNPTRGDTDGDGYSDGAEIRRYHTNPLDPNSHPEYAPLCIGPVASAADYDGDGRTDVSLYNPATGVWRLRTWQGRELSGQFGSATTQPLLGDYDGDGKTDAALYDLLSGVWYFRTMRGQSASQSFGDSEMIPIPADYNGDFRTDLGVFDVPTGMWYLLDPFTRGFKSFQFGNSACIPVPGDYDGDGRYDFAVYHTADYTWYIYTWRGQFIAFQFGRAGCVPVPGDYDGDGRYDFAVYEVPTGMWYIYGSSGEFASGQFGWGGVIPVPGDYDGDGQRDAGLYDPATGMWYIYTVAGRQYQGQFGSPAEMPVVGGR